MKAPKLDVDALAARRRPVAVLAVWAFELAVAWVLASPWVEVAARIVGRHPDGDRALFWAHGRLLLGDALIHHASTVSALVRSTLWLLAAWAVLSLVPLGGLLAALSDRDPSLRNAAARGTALFGRLAGLQGLAIVLAAVALLLVGFVPSVLLEPRTVNLLPRTALVVSLVPLLLTAAALAYLGALFDLARAIVARHDTSTLRAFVLAVRAPRHVGRLVALSLPRLLASLGLLGFGAALCGPLTSVTLIGLVHQVIAFGRVGLRASVLARALRLSDEVVFDPSEPEPERAPDAAPPSPAAREPEAAAEPTT